MTPVSVLVVGAGNVYRRDDGAGVAAVERLGTLPDHVRVSVTTGDPASLLDQWEDVDPDRPPIELLGYTGIPLDSTVAVSVDGTIAAVVPAGPGPYGSTAVHALLWPDTLSAGANEVETWVVGGTADAPTLSALRVVPH